MVDILKRVEELSDLFDNKGSERLEFNSAGLVKYNLDKTKNCSFSKWKIWYDV